MTKDKISIDINKNILTIQADRDDVKPVEKETRHVWERNFGKFNRAFRLPSSVILDNPKCTLVNGVLEVKFDKKPEEVTKRKLNIE